MSLSAKLYLQTNVKGVRLAALGSLFAQDRTDLTAPLCQVNICLLSYVQLAVAKLEKL
jgi:hypothetical protein